MKAVLKIEFQRLFRSVTFYISLGIGLILTMTQFVMVGLQESMHILDAYSPKGISEPYGVFSSYFGMAGPPLVYRQIYYLILPILAVFAYATTFCADHNSGYVKNLYTRTNKKYYYAAKYIISCTAGGLVATIPLVVNLIANMMVLPSLKPVAALGCYAGNGIALWGDIFYTHPYIFMVLYLILIFFYQFIFVSLALLLSTWVNNRFLITLFPFLLNYFSYMMLSFIKKAKYSPIIIMDMTRINALRFGPVVLECVCLTVLFGGVYFWRQKKDEGL